MGQDLMPLLRNRKVGTLIHLRLKNQTIQKIVTNVTTEACFNRGVLQVVNTWDCLHNGTVKFASNSEKYLIRAYSP